MEAHVLVYFCPLAFLVGIGGLCFFLREWQIAPDLLLGFDLAMTCGLLLWGAYGYDDAKHALRTGDERPSFGMGAGMIIFLLSQLLKEICKHRILPAYWPGMLAGWFVLMFGATIWVTLRLRYIRATQDQVHIP